ncbi:exodeoxyribonuclease VII large subunit [Hydrogenovibrio marinus]|uniref:Exodeoxyribonuclease 7 large subunit n=1 Tax=Hydrogenovibrio marinus TaxID=28885 RepID=A0A066ZXT8_HYDMR|nr:exodeoxyribonuclease VII large subunit [Hydrogenovibrio marinus]KDN95151.1 exodeoxyribonuclease VII large subunit [Hydrogenovibrio marinus]BBN59625.1 exodeoxyribonuclease 7 large subunit [Hydrogenovibrio marinus]
MILLEVPFAEKDIAKSVGARWNPVEKKWYVPDDLSSDLAPFERWLPQDAAHESTQQIVLPGSNEATSSNEKEKGIPLSQLMSQVQLAIRKQFTGAVWVTAEVANMNERRGHWYFELTETTEEGAQLASCRAMIWQSQAERLLRKFADETGSDLAPGQKVLLMVEPTFHEKFGFSLVIQDIDPSFTLGELEAALQAVRKQLISEKLYDKNKAFSMPKDFYRVAVIAPPSAAGLGDFRADADLLVKHKLCEFKYFYSAFQGENVEKEMLLAFEAFLALHQSNHFDALIIIRGGGAKLDLQPLNNYALAKAIANMQLPVLTGIGHERDNTLLDEVCAVRFDTPSKVIGAVQRAIVTSAQTAKQNWLFIEKASLLYVQRQKQQLQEMESRIQTKSLQSLHLHKQNLTPLMIHIQQQSIRKLNQQQHLLEQCFDTIFHQATNQVQLQKQNLSHYRDILLLRPAKLLESAKQNAQQLIGFILSSGPKTQLNRGFAMIKAKDTQKPITTKELAAQQDTLEIQFSDGSIDVSVIKE